MSDRKLKMRVWLGSVLLASSLALFGPLPGRGVAWAAAPPLCQPPATPTILAGTLNPFVPLPILTSPLLQVFVVGTGTFAAHIVMEPIPALPPAISDGCKEDSRFTVNGFMGQLCVLGFTAVQLNLPQCPSPLLSTTQPANISIVVHFGTEPSKPLLTLLSDAPLNYFPQVGQLPVQVRFLQIVRLQVIASH